MEITMDLTNVARVKTLHDKVSKSGIECYAVQGETTVDASSIMGLFSLNLMKPVLLRFTSNEDTSKFVKELESTGFILSCSQ